MLGFDCLKKGLGLVSPPLFVNKFSRKLILMLYLLTDQILSSDCRCFLRYLAICVLISQFMTSWILKFAFAFLSSRFPTWPKPQTKNLNIWRTKRSLSFLIGGLQKQRSQLFLKISVLKNFTIFQGKHLCWSLFLIKLQAWTALLKRGSNAGISLWILLSF